MAGAWESNTHWGSDLAQMFIQAGAARRQREQNAAANDLERERLRLEGGQQAQRDAAEQAQAAAAAADKEAVIAANKRRYVAQMVSQDPSRLPAAQAFLQQNGLDVPQTNDPNEFAMQLQGASSGRLGAPAQPDQPTDEIAKRVQLSTGMRPGQTGWSEAYSAALADQRKFELSKAKSGASSVNVSNGAVGLTPAQTTKNQEAVQSSDRYLAQLDLIEKATDKVDANGAKLGTYLEAGKNTISTLMSKAGVSDKAAEDYLAQRTDAAAAIGGFSNDLLHSLSGAAINPSEWERLSQSVPRVEDPPEVRRAKIGYWRNYYGVIKNQGMDALANGINTGKIGIYGGQKNPAVLKTIGGRVKPLGAHGQPVRREPPPETAAPSPSGIMRTDPSTGETRVWDGQAWVPQ